HAAVHGPNALGHSVVLLHQLDDLLDGGDVGPIAIEDFISQRQPLGCDDQPDTDLFAIRALVAAVAALGLRVARTLAFKVSAGDVIQQELEALAKEAFVALLEMTKEGLAQR